jgi:outer membrane protein, multidrug efflux system
MHTYFRDFRFCVQLCCVVFLSACALVRDDTAPHALIPPGQIELADDIHLARDGWPEAQWWKRYGDAQLNALIDQALAGSPSLAAAQTRVSQARSQADLLRAGAGVQVSALALLNEQRASANGFLGPYALNLPRLGITGPWYTEGAIGLVSDLNIDLWGLHRSAVEAALGARNARIAETAAVELDLSAALAQLYFSMQTSWQMLDVLQQSKATLAFAAESHRNKVERGLESQLPVHASRAQVLAIDRQIAATEAQIKELRESIRALVGAGPDNLPEIKPVPLPPVAATLPQSLSYQLLARRPDLQAMRWYVQSSFSQIDVAKAAFYPMLDIKALVGVDSLHLSKLFQSGSQQINIIPGLYLPIFDGGRLNANLRGARAASDMLIEQYNQAVLNAVRDVAISSSRLDALDDEWRLQTEKVEATRFAQKSAEALYQRGLASRQLAVEAGLPVYAEQMALLLLNGQRIAEDIALTKALGGGYMEASANDSELAAFGGEILAANTRDDSTATKPRSGR